MTTISIPLHELRDAEGIIELDNDDLEQMKMRLVMLIMFKALSPYRTKSTPEMKKNNKQINTHMEQEHALRLLIFCFSFSFNFFVLIHQLFTLFLLPQSSFYLCGSCYVGKKAELERGFQMLKS